MCQSMRIQRDLVSAGLIVNKSKFQWIPTKCIVWLGFELDLNQGQFTILETKLQALLRQLAKVTDA